MNNSLTMRTFAVLLLGVVGASLGACLYFYGTPSTPESSAFIRSPEFITWMFVNEVLFALYPMVLVFLWKPFHQLGKYLRWHWMEILTSSLLMFGLYILPSVISAEVFRMDPLPFEYSGAKILILMIAGFFVSALPLSVGIWLVQIAVRERFRAIHQSKDDIQFYISLREYVRQFLLALGVLLSLFILASAALRKALIATGTLNEQNYPPIYLLISGAYYTMIIALVYFPAYVSLVSTGNRILDAHFALPAPGEQTWTNTYAKRKELEKFLELKVTGEQQFVTNMTLLAPFVSSIFSLLVGNA
jgi:hypothetical protein